MIKWHFIILLMIGVLSSCKEPDYDISDDPGDETYERGIKIATEINLHSSPLRSDKSGGGDFIVIGKTYYAVTLGLEEVRSSHNDVTNSYDLKYSLTLYEYNSVFVTKRVLYESDSIFYRQYQYHGESNFVRIVYSQGALSVFFVNRNRELVEFYENGGQWYSRTVARSVSSFGVDQDKPNSLVYTTESKDIYYCRNKYSCEKINLVLEVYHSRPTVSLSHSKSGNPVIITTLSESYKTLLSYLYRDSRGWHGFGFARGVNADQMIQPTFNDGSLDLCFMKGKTLYGVRIDVEESSVITSWNKYIDYRNYGSSCFLADFTGREFYLFTPTRYSGVDYEGNKESHDGSLSNQGFQSRHFVFKKYGDRTLSLNNAWGKLKLSMTKKNINL